MISPLAYVDSSARLGKNVTVHPFAYIDKNVEIGDDNVIMPYASVLSGTRMGSGNTVYQGAIVGAVPQDFKHNGEDTFVRIGNQNVIREYAVIARGTFPTHDTVIGDGNFIMQAARISHDVLIGNHCIIGNGAQISGYCQIDDCVILASDVLMQGNTRVGKYALVQSGCRFTKDIPPFVVAAHEPTCFYSINTKVLKAKGFSDTLVKHIAQTYGILYKANASHRDVIIRIREQIPSSPHIDEIIQFAEQSKLGLVPAKNE